MIRFLWVRKETMLPDYVWSPYAQKGGLSFSTKEELMDHILNNDSYEEMLKAGYILVWYEE